MLKINNLDIIKFYKTMHANIKDPESFTSTRLKLKTLDLLNQVKAKRKSPTHDDLIFQMLIYFSNNDINPENFKKPIPQQIAEVRETFVTFFKTFEEKKLLPYLERTDQSLLLILEMLRDKEFTISVNPSTEIKQITEEKSQLSTTDKNENYELKKEILMLINELENNRQFNQKGSIPIVEIMSSNYNDFIDKIKKLCI